MEFKFGDKVEIIGGFYKGTIGIITDVDCDCYIVEGMKYCGKFEKGFQVSISKTRLKIIN